MKGQELRDVSEGVTGTFNRLDSIPRSYSHEYHELLKKIEEYRDTKKVQHPIPQGDNMTNKEEINKLNDWYDDIAMNSECNHNVGRLLDIAKKLERENETWRDLKTPVFDTPTIRQPEDWTEGERRNMATKMHDYDEHRLSKFNNINLIISLILSIATKPKAEVKRARVQYGFDFEGDHGWISKDEIYTYDKTTNSYYPKNSSFGFNASFVENNSSFFELFEE